MKHWWNWRKRSDELGKEIQYHSANGGNGTHGARRLAARCAGRCAESIRQR